MVVSEATYRKRALEDPSGHWELDCGRLRQKPNMTAAHNRTMSRLFGRLFQQVDETLFEVRSNSGQVRRSAEHYYIPDVYVVPVEMVLPQLAERELEVYSLPLPLVVEIWSPSTGRYDVEAELGEYQQRGDLEIWLIHPYERTLRAWVREADGTYRESRYAGGAVHPTALPGVSIDICTLFD